MVHSPRPPSESQEGADLARWLRKHKVRFCHVPNGGLRGGRTAAQLQREGVERGAPDYLVFDRPLYGGTVVLAGGGRLSPPDWPQHGTPVGIAIELKRRGGGTASAEQTEWLDALRARGWVAFVSHGAHDAIRRLTEMGFGK